MVALCSFRHVIHQKTNKKFELIINRLQQLFDAFGRGEVMCLCIIDGNHRIGNRAHEICFCKSPDTEMTAVEEQLKQKLQDLKSS